MPQVPFRTLSDYYRPPSPAQTLQLNDLRAQQNAKVSRGGSLRAYYEQKQGKETEAQELQRLRVFRQEIEQVGKMYGVEAANIRKEMIEERNPWIVEKYGATPKFTGIKPEGLTFKEKENIKFGHKKELTTHEADLRPERETPAQKDAREFKQWKKQKDYEIETRPKTTKPRRIVQDSTGVRRYPDDQTRVYPNVKPQPKETPAQKDTREFKQWKKQKDYEIETRPKTTKPKLSAQREKLNIIKDAYGLDTDKEALEFVKEQKGKGFDSYKDISAAQKLYETKYPKSMMGERVQDSPVFEDFYKTDWLRIKTTSDIINRFREDPEMEGMTFGKAVVKNGKTMVEVLQNGKVIGYYE